MDAGEFLTLLWGDPPPGQVLVWTLPQKRSVWYNRFNSVQVGNHLDTYTGVGIAPSDMSLRSGQRATAEMIAGITGLWSDVDYAGTAHAKPNLPETEVDAMWLVDAMPVAATIVLNSGHGLQAWWLFDKPWMFADDREREEAQAMIRAWQGHMDALAAEQGWVVDATHDLARLMRLPGTWNNKSTPVPVDVLYSDGPRIDRADIGVEVAEIPALRGAVGDLLLDPGAEPPWTKFRALRDNDPKFRRSLNRERPDLPDQSPSSYDMSLASIAAVAGWPDQEITDLLIFSRRSNGDDLKLREDYYTRTIARARGPADQAAAQERLEEGGRSLADLSALLGNGVDGDRMEILDLVLHIGDPPGYWMETSAGSITLGGVNDILDQGRFLTAIAASTQLVLAPCKKIAWARKAQAILRCCRVVELGEASHPATEMAALLDTYLDSQTILEDQNVAAEQGLPFRRDGEVLFKLGGFRQFVRFAAGENLSSHKLAARLRLCGVKPAVVRAVIQGAETTRNYWRR